MIELRVISKANQARHEERQKKIQDIVANHVKCGTTAKDIAKAYGMHNTNAGKMLIEAYESGMIQSIKISVKAGGMSRFFFSNDTSQSDIKKFALEVAAKPLEINTQKTPPPQTIKVAIPKQLQAMMGYTNIKPKLVGRVYTMESFRRSRASNGVGGAKN
jgi:hypothetical protein